MTCDELRAQLLEFRRRRLEPAGDAEVRAHLRSCVGCARRDTAEAVLDDLLEKLPRPAAPSALKRRLALLAGPGAPPSKARFTRRIRLARVGPALAAGLALFAGGVLLGRGVRPEAGGLDRLADEAVGDHLRVLVSSHPLDIESGGSHQVKPWFEGRLDFAPVVPSEGLGMTLEGGAVGWFLDRRAAVLQYALRKHKVTLLAFRADGLAWPGGRAPSAEGEVQRTSLRGFHVFLWRAGGVGYALVSDADASEMGGIAARAAAATRGQPAR